jgi:hypothetical protein
VGALRFFPASIALALAHPGIAQTEPASPPRILDGLDCQFSSPSDSEVVVCGRRSPNGNRYRIPAELRDNGPVDARNESPVAQRREQDSLDRFGAQTVGPGGYLQHSRQVDCDWRAARQELQGRQPDCTVRINPDAPSDWQRR